MECRLASSTGPWSCRVSIRYEFDKNGRRLEEVVEKPFGSIINNKAEVEVALRRAQLAILHPDMTESQILKITEDDLFDEPPTHGISLSFSRNVVCVDLEGPDLTDLSFIDLPGQSILLLPFLNVLHWPFS